MANVDAENMYRQYAKPVYHYLLGQCGSAPLAEEMTAETFYRAVKGIHRYNHTCKLQTWLFQIAKHVWYQALEKRKKRPVSLEGTAEPAERGPSLEDAYEAKERKLQLYRQMQRLDETTREVMYLRLTGELSYAEIAELLGRSENWARVIYYRGKERMRQYGEEE